MAATAQSAIAVTPLMMDSRRRMSETRLPHRSRSAVPSRYHRLAGSPWAKPEMF